MLIRDIAPYADEFIIETFGEPDDIEARQDGGVEWRYSESRKLAINPVKMVGFDHSAGQGGGLFKLMFLQKIVSSEKDAQAHASRWLRARISNGAPPKKIVTNKPPAKGLRKVAGKRMCECAKDGASRVSYLYTDLYGDTAYVKRRVQCLTCAKKFQWFCRVIDGRFEDGKGDAEHLPYRLDEWYFSSNPVVYLAEGEKCADVLRLCFCKQATSVDQWRPLVAEFFRGFEVVCYPDRDTAGTAKFEAAKQALTGIAASIELCRADYGDLNDIADLALKRSGVDDFIYWAPRRHVERAAR
ncbi:MAG: hypothetical protein RIA10_06700 [Amphiplicatus sp.]